MSADVYATVTEAIRSVVTDTYGIPTDPTDGNDGLVSEAARAAVDALAGMGDVTDEELVAVADEYDNCFDLSMVRLFLARARATDQARIAEEHDFQRTVPTDGLWCQRCGLSANRWTSQPCDPEGALARVEAKMLDAVLVWKARAEAAEAEAERLSDLGLAVEAERRALRATVERVEALRRRWMQEVHNTPATAAIHQCARDLRAALTGPKGGACTYPSCDCPGGKVCAP
jgi:hypothetical protein